MAPAAQQELGQLLAGPHQLRMAEVMQRIGLVCARSRQKAPSRAAVYQFMARTTLHHYDVAQLPTPVRDALYNLPDAPRVPGHQLAFYCFNYGDLAAMTFAAGLPWLDLYQAARTRGWRGRSRGLFDAVLKARGL